MRPSERPAHRIIATGIARTLRWVCDEIADVGGLLASLADAILSDHSPAFRVPVGPPAGLLEVVFVTPSDH